MRKKTEYFLLQIGIPADSKGFHYICDVMEMYENDESYISGKRTELYHSIAKKNKTLWSNVERCIRHAIDMAFAYGDKDAINECIPEPQKRTVGNFLACVYLKLRND